MLRTVAALLFVFIVAATVAVPAHSQTITWSFLADEVGSGLQTSQARAYLSTGAHGGITVHIESSDTSLALVTADELTPGAASVDVFVPNGGVYATFFVQALEDTTGVVYLTATAPGFSAGLDSIDVVQPALRVTGLATSQDPYDPDDVMTISVGIANGSNTALSPTQKVRVGGPGLTATVTNSNAAAAELVTTALTAQVVSVTIAPGESTSPSTVATGGVAFDGLAAGTTDVEATIPGFDPLNNNPLTVTVTAPVVLLNTLPDDIGAGLQAGNHQARLSGTQHGGTMVHLESSDSSMVLLALGRYDAGTPTLDVFVPDGSVLVSYYVQTLEDTTGVAGITATAPGFNPGVGTVNVLQPYFRLSGLNATIDTLDPNDAFFVSVGLPNGTFTSVSGQQARGGGPGLTFTVTSSADTVGLLETTSTLDDTATVFVAPGESSSPSTVSAGGVAFDGVGAGVTTVTASAVDFLPVSSGIVDVTVTEPTVAITNLPSVGVGAGLQTGTQLRAVLSASQHGGVTVHVEVADTNLALISESDLVVGSKSLDIFLADGQTIAYFYLQGKEDTTGVIQLSGSAPGFSDGFNTVDLVRPYVRITNSISLTQDTLDPPDDFAASVGVATGPNAPNFFTQRVRPGSAGVVMTAALDDSLVAELQTLADTSHTVSALIPAGESTTPSTLAAGGFAFNGLSPGVVELSVSAPGFDQWSVAFRTITVTAPTANMTGLGVVGAGLQTGGYSLSLSASAHGGVTAHIESTEPELALISDGISTPGQPFIDVFIPDGSTSFTFYLHGLEDTTGTATVVATVPAFIGDTDSIDVIAPGVEILNLSGSIDAADPVDPFVTRIGVPNGNNSDLQYTLLRRAGAPPLVVTLVSSNGAVAELVKTSEANDTVTVDIPAGAYQSPSTVATGGVALDGLASGQTVVSATIPGFITMGTGQKVVDVSNQNIYINGLASRLGKDLQSVAASAELGEPNHGGITVHIEVSDTALARVSASALVAGGSFVDVSLSNGDAEALFYLQAIDTGQVTVTATASTFAPAMQDVDLVPAGLRIIQLADTLAITDPDDEFIVQVGAVNGDSSGIVTPQALRGGGPSRTLSIASSDPDLAFIVLGNDLGAARTYVLDPGEFETPVSVASGGLALTPWNVGTVTVTASTAGFVTTDAGMPAVVLTGTPTGVDDRTPLVFALDQNVPNPFNPVTTINFSLPAAGSAELVVYDVAGRRVTTLLKRDLPAGRASVQWDGRSDSGGRVASGVYFYRLRSGARVETRKMVLLK